MSTGDDERRALVERCLDSEAKLEEQSSARLQLRRQLDDREVALQEMARKNQQLQVSPAGWRVRSNQPRGVTRRYQRLRVASEEGAQSLTLQRGSVSWCWVSNISSHG